MTMSLRLPARLDLSAARPLAEELSAHADHPLTLDGSEVRHLGGLCLQVLLAAAIRWRAAGMTLDLVERSAALEEALELFGIDQDLRAPVFVAECAA